MTIDEKQNSDEFNASQIAIENEKDKYPYRIYHTDGTYIDWDMHIPKNNFEHMTSSMTRMQYIREFKETPEKTIQDINRMV